MDAELKQYLDGMEGRINANAGAMEGRMNARFEHVVTLITDVKESLEREMDARFDVVNRRFDAMDARFDAMDARFDAQANRLDRQAALIQIGSRWTNRMVAWAERVDRSLDTKSKEIVDLNKRIDKKDNGAK
jgi:hypothetical protein